MIEASAEYCEERAVGKLNVYLYCLLLMFLRQYYSLTAAAHIVFFCFYISLFLFLYVIPGHDIFRPQSQVPNLV